MAGVATGAIEATTVRGLAGSDAPGKRADGSVGASSGVVPALAPDRCWRVATQAGTASDRVRMMYTSRRPICSAHHCAFGVCVRLTSVDGSTGPTSNAAIIGAVVNPSRRE